jgi:hypothetical protein
LTHALDAHRVAHEAAIARGRDEPRVIEFLQVKRHARRTDANVLRDLAGWNAGRTGTNEQPENPKPVLVSEGREGGDDLSFIHITTIQELL